jgi:hypothetical protein
VDYEAEQARIRAFLATAFAAAEEIVRLAWPDSPQLLDDLHFRASSQAQFAHMYRDLFVPRWQIEDLGEYDWDAVDVNPWSYLQDCLGIRGLTIVVKEGASAADVRRQLRGSAILSDTERSLIPELASVARGSEFLHELAAKQASVSDHTLVQLCENWSDDTVVSSLRIPLNSPGHSALNSPPHSRVLAHPSEAAPAADAKRQLIP